MEDTAPGSKQSLSLTPVLPFSLEAKETGPRSLPEVPGLCSPVGLPLEIGSCQTKLQRLPVWVPFYFYFITILT